MKRRDFLKKTLLAAGATVAPVELLARPASAKTSGSAESVSVITQAVAAPRARGWYVQNRAPMRPAPFLRLTPGSIVPHGWVRDQLLLQANGLNGRMQEVSDYLNYDNCGWVYPDKPGWEEMPYWMRGYSDLGYVLGDERIMGDTKRWLTGIMDAQTPDGWFGPTPLRTSLDGGPDFWPHMPLLNAFRAYYSYTPGESRVLPFLLKYFGFQDKADPAAFGKSWGGVRMGDTLDTLFWTYNLTGEPWLLGLAEKIHTHSRDWTNGIASHHNVDFSQGFREPAQYGMVTGDAKLYRAASDHWDTIYAQYGQFSGGGFAGDENMRVGYGDPRQGFETCGIVEMMQSCEILTRLSGNPVWADRTENLAFNSMPAAFDPHQKGTHYITSPNAIELDDIAKSHGQFSNNWAMQTYQLGIHNYRCCPHNYGMGWPYYAEEAWVGTADGGLCAVLYHANTVTAKVGAHGHAVTIAQQTDYPFGDAVRMSVTSNTPNEFPLSLRVPGWCEGATLRVNGRPVAATLTPASYAVIRRTWRTGDTVEMHLPQRPTVKTWKTNKNSVSVSHGPVTFSLAIAETWKQIGGTPEWPEYEVDAASPWNYALALDPVNIAHSFGVTRKAGALAANPFTHETIPMTLTARARKVPNWQPDSQHCITTLKAGPVRTDQPMEEITLIPMGAARLRLTSFPVIGDGANAQDWPVPLQAPTNITASSSHENDDVTALYSGAQPTGSGDQTIPRSTWWDHKGTSEWVQYDYTEPHTFDDASVYWFDDTGVGQCRVPQSWSLEYRNGATDSWKPVVNTGGYGTDKDTTNLVKFTPITATSLRLTVQLQPNYSGGILQWKMHQND
jgi:hypothetical protein